MSREGNLNPNGLHFNETFYALQFAAYFFFQRPKSPGQTCMAAVKGGCSEAESKEKHGVWDPMPGFTITSPYVHSRVDSNIYPVQPYARVDLNPSARVDFIPQSRTLDLASVVSYIWSLDVCWVQDREFDANQNEILIINLVLLRE